MLWILESKENASYHYNDIESLISSNELYFLPSSYSRENNFKSTNSQNIFRRTEFIRNYNLSKNLTITYPEALFEKIILRKELKNRKIILQTNNQISLEILNEKLFELDFERVDFVVEPGDFSVRGGIVDVFSYSNDLPYRIEFFGDEIESIRSFDIETQISNKNFKKIEILGDIENKDIDYRRESIFDFISDDTIVISENIDLLEESLSNSYKKLKQTNENDVENIFYSGDSIHLDIKKFKVIELNKIDNQTPDVNFNIAQQPAFNKKFNLLIENITTLNDQGYSIKIFCSNETQINRFQEIFELNKLNFDPILIKSPE
jgi:transcription-repair coupling factor (superfamily II helicase)